MNVERFCRPLHARTVVVAAVLGVGATSGLAHAQWTVVNLHPKGAPWSEARGVKDGQQVGIAGDSAVVWFGTAGSAVVLNPTPGQPAAAMCVEGTMQAGRASVLDETDGMWRSHAGFWNGSAETFVDLQPIGATNSQVVAMHDGTQVGVWFPPSEEMFSLGRACLWQGTRESFIDLTPPDVLFAEALGVYNDQQVGGNFSEFLPRACMWYGSPESYVELHPPNAFFSLAQCTNGVNQFGLAIMWDGTDFETARTEVGYWSGSADSWVNITPAGKFAGAVTAVFENQQVGATAGDAIGNAPFQAALWVGTAESYADLHSFLPPEYTESSAYGIWRDAKGVTYVVGSAQNSEMKRTEAVMWVSGSACAADFNDSGAVNSQDFFDFLTAFFGQLSGADFNEDKVINSQDFFDFLAAFFEGC